MKLSFLIPFFLILSGAGESAEEAKSKSPTTPYKQSDKTDTKTKAPENLLAAPAAPLVVINNRPPQEKENSPQSESAYWPPNWSDWAMFIIALGAFWIAIKSLKAIEIQSDVANKTLAFTLRPRLIVRHVHAIGDTRDDENIIHKPFEVSIEVANRGGTPTRIDSGNVALFISHKETPEFLQTPIPRKGTEDIFSGISLNPGVEHSFTTTCEPISAQKDLKTALEWRPGFVTIYVLGHIWYQDAVGNRYKTAFCRRYDRTKRQFERVDHPDYEYAD